MKYLLCVLVSLLGLGLITPATASAKVHHVVCLKFKPGTATENIKSVEQAFAALQQKIPGIDSLKWGTNVSKEQRSKGFTHCFILTFKSEKERDAYIEHPEHKAFVKLVTPFVDDVFVIDFLPQKSKD